MGGDPSTSTPALHASLLIRASTAVSPSPMVRRCNRPRCRPGRRHRPRAPEAIPSHPVPTMGGTTMPTRTNSSARATAICRSTSPHTVTVPPSHQPFIIRRTGAGDVVLTGGRNDFFRGSDERLRKRPRQGRGHLPVVFVGVIALVPLVPWDHSVDADIGLGPRAPSFPEAF
jgi:hypothetical protein